MTVADWSHNYHVWENGQNSFHNSGRSKNNWEFHCYSVGFVNSINVAEIWFIYQVWL